MNKKIKWAIPFAVLALSCGIAAGCSGKHTHSYTKWDQGNETQHWKVCPDDGAIDESSKANHNFVDGSCECGKTQPVKDVTITNGTTDTNGTVTLSKTTGKTGDSVTVTVAPNEGYQLKSLTINGANVFGAMTGNTYEFTVADDTTVIAVFEKIASSSVNAVITGKKYGVTGNSLTAGTPVTLSATGRDDIVTEIKDGGDNLVIEVDEIAGDNWSVKVDGYIAAAIIIPRDAEYTSAIALEYDLMENLKATWGNSDSVDLSKQNEGKITHTSGYVQWVSSKKSYESVAITATVGKGGSRQGVFIRFKGDNYDADKYVMVSKENSDKIGWCAMDGGSDYKGSPISPWDDKIKPLTKEDYELTLVRDGADIYFFVDGEYIDKKTFNDYADKECYVGLFCTNATTMENSERTFEIAQASDFIEVSVTNETATDAHGTVTIDKQTAKLNEQVTVTLAPETGYKIKDLKIDGVSVLSQMTGTSYTFTALKDTTVVAEFEESKPVNSLELTVNAANGFTAEGAKITLEQLGEKRTAVVGTNGKAILGSTEKPVALGTHNVYADFGGYQIKLGTVNVEASDSDESQGKPVSVTLGFTGSSNGKIEYADAVSSANPATGELTYKLGKADHGAYNNKYDIVDIEGGGYFATKIKFNDIGGNKRSLSLILLVQKPDGTTKEIKYVIQNANRFFGEDGKFYMNLDDNSLGGGNGAFDKNNAVNIDKYSAALKGDGLWLVLGYNAETGGLVTYAGTELTSVRPVKTWGTLPAGLKITDIGVGNWFGDSNQAYGGNNDTATVTFKYGATMEDIGMAIEEKVTVTASVNDETMGTVALDATDGKYFSDTQANVTVTANKGYVLKSIKVGDGEAVTEGWTTDGNVYTYSFTVSENTTVVATFEALEVWESATLTLNGVAENTEVKLYDGVDTITATAGANGVVTFTGEKQIGKKVYTVTVKNVVFNVDFTTESSIRKTIGTVTVGDFSARDNYKEGAKVIDMGAAKNSTEYAVTFNLKTTSTAAGWQQRWSLLLINGDNNTTTGIGCIGKNNNVLTVWGATGASPDDANQVYKSEAKYLKFDELVHGKNGVNMKVVRQGSKATMYFELEGEWIEMLTVTLGSGETNLKFACSYGVEWQISGMAINYISEFDYLVNASIKGDAHGYKVNVEQTANAATVVIQTDNANDARSYFPNAIKVNGTPIDFSTVTKESLGANRCKYTFTLNITENTYIVVTLAKGTQVNYSASVNDGTMGNIVCDMEDSGKVYYWNDMCTLKVTANEGYELVSIVIGEGSEAITVTADGANKWTQNGKVYTYNYLVTGDIKVVANLKKTPLVDVTPTITAKDTDGTTEITLAEGTQIKLVSADGVYQYTYTVGGAENPAKMVIGEYKVTCYGYADTTATVSEEGVVAINLVKVIAYATSDKITVDSVNGTIEIKGNGLSDREPNQRKINAEYVISEEVKNATDITLTFTAKATKKDNRVGNDWVGSRFGVQIGEGEIGFMVFPRNNNEGTASDVAKLIPGTNLALNPDRDGKSEQKWHGDDPQLAWLANALYSETGAEFKVVRSNGTISIFAKNGEDWVALDTMGTQGETAGKDDIGKLTINDTVKNQIKFTAGGDNWTFSAIEVTVNEATAPEQGGTVTPTTPVEG